MAALTLILLPVLGSVLLVWGAFQVFLDLRTAKQRKVVDRLTESPTGRRQQEVKESLLRKRASDLQTSTLDGLMTRLQVVNKLQRVLDQAARLAHPLGHRVVGREDDDVGVSGADVRD